MLVPISWLNEFVGINVSVSVLAERLTLAGLKVNNIRYIGVPQDFAEGVHWALSNHLVWDRDRILLGAICEVRPHPNADRLVLALVDYGGDELEQCVTGASNLFEYAGAGPLDRPLWTAFSAEGAELWDGFSDEPKRVNLKRRMVRGVLSRSMVCSEKELGISEDHTRVVLLHEAPRDLPPGTPLQDALGDVVLDIGLTSNLAHCNSVLGVAREVAALLDKELSRPSYDFVEAELPSEGQIRIEIREPELNPRITLALLRDVKVQSSPEWMQQRLKLVGQEPINSILDVINYVALEVGQPLQVFDHDVLVQRAGGEISSLHTRLPKPGETLDTLDGIKRNLDDFNILLCDQVGALSLGGIIGGVGTEVTPNTRNVLVVGGNWDSANIARTMKSQGIYTESAMRFSKGIHPSRTTLGVRRGIELIQQVSGETVAQDVIDVYPAQPETVQVTLPIHEVQRLSGMDIACEVVTDLLTRLEFDVTTEGGVLHAIVPDYRLDIRAGNAGRADLLAEILRVYGYDQMPSTAIADEELPQWSNKALRNVENIRDIMIMLGLHETVGYSLTTPACEAKLMPPGVIVSPIRSYVRLANSAFEKQVVLRQTLLCNLLENVYTNAKYRPVQQVFEMGKVYFQRSDHHLPDEKRRLAIVMIGAQDASASTDDGKQHTTLDFYDLKGVIEGLLRELHIVNAVYTHGQHPSFHPGRSAQLGLIGSDDELVTVGTFGELHPLVAHAFGFEDIRVLAAEIDLDILLENVAEISH